MASARDDSVVLLVLAISGAAISAHRLNSVRYSSGVEPPLPIWSRSGSFQAPGRASADRSTVPSKLNSIAPKLSWMSAVVRHRLAIGGAHAQGLTPGSGAAAENTMGRPVAASAWLMRVYSACSTCCWLCPGKAPDGMLQRSYLR